MDRREGSGVAAKKWKSKTAVERRKRPGFEDERKDPKKRLDSLRPAVLVFEVAKSELQN